MKNINPAEELELLRKIEDAWADPAPGLALPAELPRQLFEHALVRREAGGEVSLTKNGERVLFRHRCVEALRGHEGAIDPGVERWLRNKGFVEPAKGPHALVVTPQGLSWLSSME